MIIDINPFDSKSVKAALKQVEQYKRWLKAKETELLTKLGDYGVTRVRVNYSWIQYDGNTSIDDISCNVNGNVATIRARGEEIAFIEFGAGVWFNDAESYPIPRPKGIVGIGQYGKGKGNDPRGWYYTKDGVSGKHTKGNPPAMGMYKTTLDLATEVTKIAKEVFG
jgi:hypothetical protein